ncbi:MAG TPA: PTS sugar transporter subunit IIA [Phycisphaerae bacterium]|nr:PTS sugar transporter subunit IIA [Phycisphaerae bacterium]HOJ74382.1 PTS sugar transporter subunit IIA [Phycisphaerae bacterium]HOM53006.1 PTS sugar transporter subunit IIA [Phycisphaerae bacterium]HON68270.1 PTS sugar transporter subunit IIA [Phycisphaerae bacterium]HOQ85780.1 PTS sugar transporter subunit IIA [Phycisphaerae bacterium]
MPYRNMSLEDFAQHVGMDAREVQKLAERGKLPGQKVGGEWRFNRARVTEWLQQEMHTLDEARLITLERTMGAGTDDESLILTDLIGLEGVDVELRANTKASVLRELVGLANRTGLLYDAEGLLKALEAREEMCSTGLQHGVAIPHPRQPMPYVSAEPLVCFARTSRGIGFGSPYGGLSHLFFLICCHDDRHHLRVLARLMRVLSPEVIEALDEAETREAVLEILIEKEKQIVTTT